MKRDLDTLTIPEVLAKDEGWRETAQNVINLGHHHGQLIPPEIFAEYKPKIEKALSQVPGPLTKKVA